jgi:type II secretory pathway component PulM
MIRLGQKQLMLIAAGLVVILALVLLVIRPLFNRRQKMELSIQRTEQRLQELIDLEQTYRQVLAENARVAMIFTKKNRWKCA